MLCQQLWMDALGWQQINKPIITTGHCFNLKRGCFPNLLCFSWCSRGVPLAMDIPLLFHLSSSGKNLLGSPQSPRLQAFCTWHRWSDLGFSQQEHRCPWRENTQKSVHSLLHWCPPKQTVSGDKERIVHLVEPSSFGLAILEKWTVELGSEVGSNPKFKEQLRTFFVPRPKPSSSVDFTTPWS